MLCKCMHTFNVCLLCVICVCVYVLQPESLRYLIQTVNCCALMGDIKVSTFLSLYLFVFACVICSFVLEFYLCKLCMWFIDKLRARHTRDDIASDVAVVFWRRGTHGNIAAD